MNKMQKSTTLLAACLWLFGFTAQADSDARANASKIFRDVPSEFLQYDSVNAKMDLAHPLPGYKKPVTTPAEPKVKADEVDDEFSDPDVEEDDEFSGQKRRPSYRRGRTAEERNKIRESARKRAREEIKREKADQEEAFRETFAKHHGLTMPEGSKVDYDERSGKLTVRSSKEDIQEVEKALAEYKKLEQWFEEQLEESRRIDGSCYTNLNGVYLVNVSDALIESYVGEEKNTSRRESRKKKKKKNARRSQKKSDNLDTLIPALDKKRALILVFDKSVSQRKVAEFKEAIGISECLCVYEHELSEDLKDLNAQGSVVLISCYGEVVKTYSSLSGIKEYCESITFWHKQGFRRQYERR